MTSHTRNAGSRFRRVATGAFASVALALGLLIGVGAGTAQADVLDTLEEEYGHGAGGGQLANLLNESLQLRALGFRPRNTDYAAIQAAMDDRPNQAPLVEALQVAVQYQTKVQAQSQGSEGPGFTIGANQTPPGESYNPLDDYEDATGVFTGGGNTSTQPIG